MDEELPKKRYMVTGSVTISVHTRVTATSAAQAKSLALDIPLCSIHHDTNDEPEGDDGNWEEWRTTGELDGELQELRVEGDE